MVIHEVKLSPRSQKIFDRGSNCNVVTKATKDETVGRGKD